MHKVSQTINTTIPVMGHGRKCGLRSMVCGKDRVRQRAQLYFD